jgi:putative tricarboxylic transport membrane protein
LEIRVRVADFIGGAVVLILGLAVIFFSSQMEYYSEFGPGPGFLPLWVGICITGCAVVLILNLLRKHEKAGAFFQLRTKEGFKLLVIIIATFLLLPFLGFAIGFGLFAGVTMRIMGRHHWVPCGLTAVGIAIGIRFVFSYWLMIPLPTGIVGW